MIKTLLLWFFLLISIFTFSAFGSTATPEIKGLRTSKQQKEPKAMYDMMMESSKQRSQRINVRLHDVQHIKKISKKARTVYGGGNNVKSPHKSKSSANTNSIKSSSLFIAAILLVGCFF